MYKIQTLDRISAIGLDNFPRDDYEIASEIMNPDAILVRSHDMLSMEINPTVKAIARAGAGVNNIPVKDLAAKGVVVFNTPGANANAVKELVIMSLLIASRPVIAANRWVNTELSGKGAEIASLAEKGKKNFIGSELKGKTLGVIGLGAIGVRVANAAKHMGMEVYGYDPYISVAAAWSLSRDIKHVTNIDEIYEKCDIITIHVPLLDSTKGTISKDAINKMKEGVILLNFARDLLVDEQAVLAGIKSGKIKKYVSDFANTTTAGQEGCIVMPHLGASTEEAEDNCAKMAVDEVRNYLENGNIINSVNFPNCDMGVCNTEGRIAILHANQANMIAKFSSIFGELGINISDFTNKSKGNYAYTLADADSPITEEIAKKLSLIEGVIRVRVVK